MTTQQEIFVKLQQKWIELNNVKNGDKVRVIRIFKEGEGGCTSHFNDIDYTGRTFTIDNKLENNMDCGINLKSGPILPYFCLEPVKKEVFYSMGQRFSSKKYTYILAKSTQSGSTNQSAILVCLEDGNLYTYPVLVSDLKKITQEEFDKIAGDNADKFELIKK